MSRSRKANFKVKCQKFCLCLGPCNRSAGPNHRPSSGTLAHPGILLDLFRRPEGKRGFSFFWPFLFFSIGVRVSRTSNFNRDRVVLLVTISLLRLFVRSVSCSPSCSITAALAAPRFQKMAEVLAGKTHLSAAQAARITEPMVGITEYANSSHPGFRGTMKYRYSDFIV